MLPARCDVLCGAVGERRNRGLACRFSALAARLQGSFSSPSYFTPFPPKIVVTFHC
jgi:hypothetical protein